MIPKAAPPPSPIPITPNPTYEVGYVKSIKNYLLVLNGLPTVKINEVLVNHNNARCLVTSVSSNAVEALMLDDVPITPNEMFTRTYKQLSINIGPHLLGRTINPLGLTIDGKGRLNKEGTELPLEQVAGGIKTRQFIKKAFHTGVSTIDMLVPVAQGQRELIIGSAKSGKTGFILDTIINQKLPGVEVRVKPSALDPKQTVCIYTIIGKPIVETRRLIDILTINHALEYTIIIATSSADPASLIYIAPSVGFTMAEYFQRQGRNVLLILDDMGIHAKFYREISLISNRAPGRESYPADVFSQHAKLIERAGNFRPEYGGGSITALPVIETNFDDYTGYITTNLMAMTDGHLMFNSSMYHRGTRPALDINLSVSRVGRQTQNQIQKVLADKIKNVLAESEKLETLSTFGSEVSAETQATLVRGKQVHEILQQAPLVNIHKALEIILLGLVFTPFFEKNKPEFVRKNKTAIISFLSQKLNLDQTADDLDKIEEEKDFFTMLEKLTPELEKVCT